MEPGEGPTGIMSMLPECPVPISWPIPRSLWCLCPSTEDSLLLQQALTLLLRLWFPSRVGFLTWEGPAWGGEG